MARLVETGAKHNRVGMYLLPCTRTRLNMVKSFLSLRAGKPLSQDQAIDCLIEEFVKNHPEMQAVLTPTSAA